MHFELHLIRGGRALFLFGLSFDRGSRHGRSQT
jgi:hypothetical protein